MLKNKNWDIPIRDFNLKIFSGRKERQTKNQYLSNLSIDNKITFDTSASVSGGVNELNLNITGLTVDKMEELATCCSMFADPVIYNNIELYGGYTNNSGLLFTGNIINAIPNFNNANYSISIKAIAGYTAMLQNIKNYSFNGNINVITICQQFAKDLGFVLYIGEDLENINILNYYYTNHSIKDNITYLANITGLDIYIEYNCLIVKQKSKPIKNFRKFIVDSNNLIGAVRPMDTGCECDIVLNPSIRTGVEVELKNQSFKRLNQNKFVIMSYSHHGDTRGNTWKTTLQLIKKDLYE